MRDRRRFASPLVRHFPFAPPCRTGAGLVAGAGAVSRARRRCAHAAGLQRLALAHLSEPGAGAGACGGCGCWCPQPWRPGQGVLAPLLALAMLGAGVLWSWLPGGLPSSLALSALGLLAAAAVLLAAGAGARARADAAAVFAAFCCAYLAAGLLNAVLAGVQVFAPGWCDGTWLAASGIPGRAVGNLRQPNHLSSVLTWGCIAVVGLVGIAPAGATLGGTAAGAAGGGGGADGLAHGPAQRAAAGAVGPGRPPPARWPPEGCC